VEFKLKGTAQHIRFINTHVEFEESSQLAIYIQSHPPADGVPIILMGDMNITSKKLKGHFDKTAKLLAMDGKELICQLLTGEQATHINTQKMAVDYDQIYCIATKKCDARGTHDPKEIFVDGSVNQKMLVQLRQNLLDAYKN